MPSSAIATADDVNSAMNNAHKIFLIFMIDSSNDESVQQEKDLSDDPKNEGEALHIVSPSTIPLTLGEEMAVLVLPRKV